MARWHLTYAEYTAALRSCADVPTNQNGGLSMKCPACGKERTPEFRLIRHILWVHPDSKWAKGLENAWKIWQRDTWLSWMARNDSNYNWLEDLK